MQVWLLIVSFPERRRNRILSNQIPLSQLCLATCPTRRDSILIFVTIVVVVIRTTVTIIETISLFECSVRAHKLKKKDAACWNSWFGKLNNQIKAKDVAHGWYWQLDIPIGVHLFSIIFCAVCLHLVSVHESQAGLQSQPYHWAIQLWIHVLTSLCLLLYLWRGQSN